MLVGNPSARVRPQPAGGPIGDSMNLEDNCSGYVLETLRRCFDVVWVFCRLQGLLAYTVSAVRVLGGPGAQDMQTDIPVSQEAYRASILVCSWRLGSPTSLFLAVIFNSYMGAHSSCRASGSVPDPHHGRA